MADEILFAGGRLDSVSVSGAPSESTTAGTFDSSYADCSILLGTSDVVTGEFKDSSFAATDVVTGETLFMHLEYFVNSNSTTATQLFVAAYDSSGYPWLALKGTGANNTFSLYYNSGTGASPTWTAIGSTFTMAAGVRYKLDIKLTLGSPHSAEVSRDNNLVSGPVTFTQASLTSLRSMRITAPYSGTAATRVSQFMATRGISTINGKVKYSRASGAGSNSGWTGAYTNVNEAVNSDSTVDSTTSAAVKQTYAMGDVTVPAGFAIKSVFHFLRAKNDGSSPANIKSTLRSGGADYSSSDLSGIGTSFGSLGMRYDNDPATGTLWTQAGWNAAEAGYESAA